MKSDPALEALWNDPPSRKPVLTPPRPARLPPAARRYLEHAIAWGTPPASTVRLQMQGEIKLKRWFPFTAEQVIAWDRGMVWSADARVYGMPVTGFDRLIDHEGAMQWKLLGVIPLMRASGKDTTRSCAGRMLAESVWLPSSLCAETVVWSGVEDDTSQVYARAAIEGEHGPLTLGIDGAGRLSSILLPRWGSPDGGAPGYFPFGGIVEQEKTFGGFTIPTRLRVGWHFGTPRFETDGEFFRCTIDHAEFR